jgi:hypothetical protein
MQKIDSQTALYEIEKWLDFKRIKEAKRESYKAFIDNIQACIEDGSMIVDDECNLIYTLLFPIGENEAIKTLSFSPRLSAKDRDIHMKGVAANDANGRLFAIIAALTKKSKEVVKALDTEDMAVAESIAVFFT